MKYNYWTGYISLHVETTESIQMLVTILRQAREYVLKELICDLTFHDDMLCSYPTIFNLVGNLYIGTFEQLDPSLVIILPQILGSKSREKAIRSVDVIIKSETLTSFIDLDQIREIRRAKQTQDPLFINLPVIPRYSYFPVNIHISAPEVEAFRYGVLGGTFDHFHPGHCLLLTAAAMTVNIELGIGILSDSMLHDRELQELVQNYTLREHQVKRFMNVVAPELALDIFSIQDLIGPAGTDSKYKVIYVNHKTQSAVGKINQIRQENQKNPLCEILVDLSNADQLKLSSTEIRKEINKKSNYTYLELKNLWKDLTERLEVDPSKSENWFEMISMQYLRSYRHHHNMVHLHNLIKLLEESPFERSDKLLLALIFHDLIFYPSHKGFEDDRSDEMKSKELYSVFVIDTNLPEEFFVVGDYILAATNHKPISETQEEKVFLDLNLSVLASEDYESYTSKVRKEYSVFSDEEYYQKRVLVLKQLLERESIFYTQYFIDKYEERARFNIQREVNKHSIE